MIRSLVFFFLFVWIPLSGYAQGRVYNIRLRVPDSSTIEILYDLTSARPTDSVFFEIHSRIRGSLRIAPQFVRGDVGTQVKAGTNRRISWKAVANGYSLDEEIQARVFVKARSRVRAGRALIGTDVPVRTPQAVTATPEAPAPPLARVPASTPRALPELAVAEKPSFVAPDTVPARPVPVVVELPPLPPAVSVPPNPVEKPVSTVPAWSVPQPVGWRIGQYTGAGWALVSAIAPGIGNIFVQTPTPKVGLRPLLTLGCYGLLVYGFSERKKSRDVYAMYEQQKSGAAGEPYYQTANGHHQRYMLATRGALLVTAVDVVLTFLKGFRNTHPAKGKQRFGSFSLRPGLQAGQPTAGMQYSF